jgi:hypothetical protein
MSIHTRNNALRKQRIREGLHTLARIAGPRCMEFEPGCYVCQAYRFIDVMQRLPTGDEVLARTVSTHATNAQHPTTTPTKEQPCQPTPFA